MSWVIDTVIITVLFTLFGYFHSLLASNKIKKRIRENIGSKIAFYRLFYNITSLLSFFLIYQLSPKPSFTLYDLNYPWDIVILVVQFFSLLGFIWAASKIDLFEFLGIKQIQRYLRNEYSEELDEKYELNKEGAFKYSRHPIYFFSIMFLGLRPSMTFFYLIFFICITAYFLIGSIYEEKKLVELFGDEYKEYQKNVPWIIPYKVFK